MKTNLPLTLLAILGTAAGSIWYSSTEITDVENKNAAIEQRLTVVEQKLSGNRAVKPLKVEPALPPREWGAAKVLEYHANAPLNQARSILNQRNEEFRKTVPVDENKTGISDVIVLQFDFPIESRQWVANPNLAWTSESELLAKISELGYTPADITEAVAIAEKTTADDFLVLGTKVIGDNGKTAHLYISTGEYHHGINRMLLPSNPTYGDKVPVFKHNRKIFVPVLKKPTT